MQFCLHRATCVATAKSALLQLLEQRCYILVAYFYWLVAQNIARQVARGVLHCAILQKSVPALPQIVAKSRT